MGLWRYRVAFRDFMGKVFHPLGLWAALAGGLRPFWLLMEGEALVKL